MNPSRPATFIATLGGQPQVVTLALDALLAQNIVFDEIIVLYLSSENKRVAHSLQKLAQEFVNGRYQTIPIRYRPLGIGHPTTRDIHDIADANIVWDFVNQLLASLKAQQKTLHIGISGGRRILGMLTMSAAMLHFGQQDTLWHMYTPDQWQQRMNEGAIMHLPPDSGFQLIRVPMLPWGSYFPALRQLSQLLPSSDDVLARHRAVLDQGEQTRCQQVLADLTDRQQEVVMAFAQGLNPQQAAAHLHITLATVNSHKTIILATCRNVWAVSDDVRLDYRFLADKFAYLAPAE